MELNQIPQNPNNWGNVADLLNENSGKIEAETAKLNNATTKFKGYFSTSTALSAKWPSPLVGDTAWVGATYPGVVYRCDVAGAWLATTDVPSVSTVNLSEYYKLSDVLDKLKLNVSTAQTLTNIGEMAWNQNNGTAELKISNEVTLSIGQEMFVKAKNTETTQILNGTPVYISGAQGGLKQIKRASNLTDSAEKTIGLATQDITANASGIVTVMGEVHDLNTSAFTEGALIWLGANGTLTTTKPVDAPYHIIIGVCTRSHATEGSIFVSVKESYRAQIDQLRSDLNENKNSILANLLFDFDFSQIIEFNKSNNFYINQNGQAIANKDCAISDFIDCTKAKYLMPYFYIYLSGYCAYYSEANENSFISSFQISNSDFGNLKNIPTGANYIRLSAFIDGDVSYKNDYPIALIVGNNKNIPSLPIIQKSDSKNVKVNGTICSLQRWGNVVGQYLKVKFPSSATGLNIGISYVFDLTIRKLELNTSSKNNYLKLRVEFLRHPVTQYIPNITYISGNTSLINNVKLYYEMDGGNTYRIPSVVIDNSDTLLGIVVDNMNIASLLNTEFTANELSAFTLTEETSIAGLTLINDYSTILLEDNLPMTKAQGKASFVSIDNIPSKLYDYTLYSAQVDPETGETNSWYRTIYKRVVAGETRLVAKVWGSNAGQKIFRAFDSNGNVIAAYSRDTQTGENSVILTLNITLGTDVASYSIGYVTAGTPNQTNASLTLYYENIGTYINNVVQPQIDNINSKIANGLKYVDIKGIGIVLSKFRTLINADHAAPLNLLFVGDSIVNFQNAWNNGETPVYYNKPLCMYNPNTFTNRIWELLNPGALYYDKTAKTYGGAMTFLKTNPTPGDLTPSDGVTIFGSGWMSNVSGSNYNQLGDCGGYPVAGWHEFLFSKNQGDYIEFSVPSGILGFSVVIECSTSNRSSDGTNFYAHAQSVEVYFNGNLQGTVNTSDKNGNIRFDFTFANATSATGTIKVLLTEIDKWVGIWGVESWSSKHAVRPINNGLAGHSIQAVYIKHERAVSSANPDLIIFCGMLNNDSILSETQVQQYYELMWDKLQLLNKPVIGISTHWGTYNRMYYNPADMNHDDPMRIYNSGVWNPKGYHPAYLRIFNDWCKKHDIPLINPCQYMYDEYGDDSTTFMVDAAHLNVAGHNLYKGLIDTSMIGNY